ncbi:MAG: thioredoxin domain-containing protein [Ignavibacteriales bacterium]|nr:thioredoxin domain-containing protein [Ignavibacteriales bacterium]
MKSANRLAGETSPYLLQHAHNPVDWHPWGRRPSRRPGARTSRCSCPSATRPATGATSWSANPSRTRRSPVSSTKPSSASRSTGRNGPISIGITWPSARR